MNNLRSFNAELKLQQAVLALMIHQLVSAEELEDQMKVFTILDTNKDGLLQRSELSEGFRAILGEVVDAELGAIMELADLDGDGELGFSEWLVASSRRESLINEKRLRQAFCYFDKDNSGGITLEELKEAMCENGAASNEDGN